MAVIPERQDIHDHFRYCLGASEHNPKKRPDDANTQQIKHRDQDEKKEDPRNLISGLTKEIDGIFKIVHFIAVLISHATAHLVTPCHQGVYFNMKGQSLLTDFQKPFSSDG
jgi:hypothetical protein